MSVSLIRAALSTPIMSSSPNKGRRLPREDPVLGGSLSLISVALTCIGEHLGRRELPLRDAGLEVGEEMREAVALINNFLATNPGEDAILGI